MNRQTRLIQPLTRNNLVTTLRHHSTHRIQRHRPTILRLYRPSPFKQHIPPNRPRRLSHQTNRTSLNRHNHSLKRSTTLINNRRSHLNIINTNNLHSLQHSHIRLNTTRPITNTTSRNNTITHSHTLSHNTTRLTNNIILKRRRRPPRPLPHTVKRRAINNITRNITRRRRITTHSINIIKVKRRIRPTTRNITSNINLLNRRKTSSSPNTNYSNLINTYSNNFNITTNFVSTRISTNTLHLHNNRTPNINRQPNRPLSLNITKPNKSRRHRLRQLHKVSRQTNLQPQNNQHRQLANNRHRHHGRHHNTPGKPTRHVRNPTKNGYKRK